ncbi:MAG TPA: UDP-N-acetylmuramate dehydrogenase [Flavitalea sp.]|nr:UDP-N-acetylmuramate dehydrogenase [Flavitalea sp.]
MQIQENIPLRQYNTFRIEAIARHFAVIESVEDLDEATGLAYDQLLILGGGSNLLITRDVDGLVLKNNIKGITKVRETDSTVILTVGAGENWHRFVESCIAANLGGVENLSLIPGNTGASPMQNIGAYGVEIKDVFEELEAYDLHDRVIRKFTRSDCEFGYRESVFKNRYRNRFVILNVSFRLSKLPTFNISYGAIGDELEKMGVTKLSLRAVSQAVINIRSSKLPDPAVIGNAGSFFKNPVVSAEKFEELKVDFPAIPSYPAGINVKLAAGWLVEQCGWKGFRRGDAGCHAKQALVLVNHGTATGMDILQLSEEIIQSVLNRFGIELEREVNII